MNVALLLQVLREELPSLHLKVDTLPLNETCLELPPTYLKAVVELLVVRLGVTHLSTIAGEDTGREIVLLYHFWDRGGLTLRVKLPRDGASIDSVRDLVPGAVFYEREVVEMLGVSFDGYSDLAPLFLPDDWDDAPPLRRREGEEA